MAEEKENQRGKPDHAEEIDDSERRLQKIRLKVLDVFIGLCIAAIVIVIAVGFLNR